MRPGWSVTGQQAAFLSTVGWLGDVSPEFVNDELSTPCALRGQVRVGGKALVLGIENLEQNLCAKFEGISMQNGRILADYVAQGD